MTHTIQTLNNYLTSPVTEALSIVRKFFGRVWNAFKVSQTVRAIKIVRQEMMKYKEYRDTYNQLAALSDKELADIGLSRGMIHWVAMDAYREDKEGL